MLGITTLWHFSILFYLPSNEGAGSYYFQEGKMGESGKLRVCGEILNSFKNPASKINLLE